MLARVPRIVIVAAVVATTVGGWALFIRDSYGDQVSAACSEVTRRLVAAGLTSWEQGVILTAEARTATISRLEPPPEHQATHAAILATEAKLGRLGREAMEAKPAMRPLDHVLRYSKPIVELEMAQLERFEEIGASGECPEPVAVHPSSRLRPSY